MGASLGSVVVLTPMPLMLLLGTPGRYVIRVESDEFSELLVAVTDSAPSVKVRDGTQPPLLSPAKLKIVAALAEPLKSMLTVVVAAVIAAH